MGYIVRFGEPEGAERPRARQIGQYIPLPDPTVSKLLRGLFVDLIG